MKVNDSLQNLKFPENNCLILDEKESYASTGRRYKTLTITVPVQMRSSHMEIERRVPSLSQTGQHVILLANIRQSGKR